MIPDPLEHLERSARDMDTYMSRHHRTVFGRYPLLFSLLGSFGVAAIIYGFEQTLDDVPFLHDHPLLPLLIGVAVLIITGSLYKRVEKKLD